MTIARLIAVIARLRASRRGNVLIIFGFVMIPMVFATGMGVDYARAARLQTKLNAIADAAALAAVTQPMMLQTDDTAKTTAENMFNAQAETLGSDLVYDPSNLTVTITDVNNASSPGRIATVSYTAASRNAFGSILGRATLAIAGSSTAQADKAPYIDFYVMLDTSPSMLLPATSAGLTQMRQQDSTSYLPNGCAFACHTQNPHADNIYIRDNNSKDIWLDPNNNLKAYAVDKVLNGYIYSSTYSKTSTKIAKESSGYYADSYWLASNNASFPTLQKPNIEMRIDAEQTAVQQLVPTARSIADENHVSYRMAVTRFDYGPNFQTVSPLTKLDSDANVQTVITNSTNLPMTYWYKNSMITSASNIDDESTDFATAFNNMNKMMPTPGSGVSSNNPQEVLFIITDGMSDENISGMGRTHRELQPTHLDQCAAIKNRNIRIAILYTEYLPGSLTGDPWSQTNVAPYLPNVAPALQACASPGLYQMVSSDDSIPDALEALFRQAVATAHLTQ
jgi:Flp pilus assembly protein TadG